MARPAPLLVLLLSLGAAPGPGLALTFDEVASAAGLAFRHAAPDGGGPLNYPETNGGGVCWGDVDGDGVDDLFLVNGKFNDSALQARYDPRSALFLSDGDGTFTDASAAWGADRSGWAQGCSLADPDGDGDLDLLVVGYDLLWLLRNDGGRFTEAAAAANLSLAGKCGDGPCFGETGSWADYDLDGDLDLYVTTMVEYSLEEGGIVSPTNFPGQPNVLFRNRGDGTFEDATAEAGVDDDPSMSHSKSFQSSWADYDRDGDPDLYIASDTTANTLFRNNGDGTFLDVAPEAGVDDARSSMGLAFQDATGDGRPDLFFTHYAGEQHGFYQNEGDGTFLDRSGEGDLANIDGIGWGTGFHDFDHDGDVDLYEVNGHTTPFFMEMNQTSRIWLQLPNGTFDEVTADAGPAWDVAMVARGSAAADHDLDGDLDLAINAIYNQTAKLFRHGGAAGHWLQLEVRQPGMNRFAIGAEVTVTPAGGAPVTHVVQAGSSFLSQDSLVVHAGLGGAARADVQVRWPGGAVETWPDVAADQRVRLTRGVPGVLRDTLAPHTSLALGGAARDGWYREPVPVTLTAVDRAMGVASGVTLTEVRLAGAWAPYAAPVVVAEEGWHAVAGRSTDAAGHVEPPRAARFGVDRTPPVVGATLVTPPGPGGWFPRIAGVTFAAEDALSGVHAVWSRVDGGAWQAGLERQVQGLSGEHLLEYYAEDVAGNAGAVQALIVRVDAAPPTVALPLPLAVAFGGGRVEVAAEDVGAGVHAVAFFLGDEATPRFVDHDGSDGWVWDADAAPGLHRLRVVATDGAGLPGQDAGWLLAAPVPPLGLLLVSGVPLLARRR